MPSIVFLQEVVPETYKIIENELSDTFTLIPSSEKLKGYFTMILLKKQNVKFLSFKVIPFPTSVMLRSLLYVEVSENIFLALLLCLQYLAFIHRLRFLVNLSYL